MRVFRIFVVVAVLLVAFATPAVAGPDVMPIKGTVMGEHGRLVGDPACPGYAWSFSSSGVGQMSHLGRVGYELTQCTNPVDERFESVGTVTFTAANDDTLSITHTMTSWFVFGPEPGPPLGFMMEGTWDAAGGTGRFLHATGGGSLAGVGDIPDEVVDLGIPDGLLQLNFTGTIAYDASDRSGK